MNANIKKIGALCMLVALAGARCWGAAMDDDSRLFFAIHDDNVAEVETLLPRVDVNEENKLAENFTPLMVAAMSDRRGKVMNLLLGNKAIQVNRTGGPGRYTALMIAAMNNSSGQVKKLLDAQAEVDMVNGSNKTALMYAAEFGFSSVVQMLMDAGANADLKDSKGYRALDYAKKKGDPKTIEILTMGG